MAPSVVPMWPLSLTMHLNKCVSVRVNMHVKEGPVHYMSIDCLRVSLSRSPVVLSGLNLDISFKIELSY